MTEAAGSEPEASVAPEEAPGQEPEGRARRAAVRQDATAPVGPSDRESDWMARRRFRILPLVAAVLLLLWVARDIIGPFVIAAVLAYAFSPVVNAIQSRSRLPRAVIILLGYVVVLAALGVAVYFVAHRAATEFREFTATGGPDLLTSALEKLAGKEISLFGQTVSTASLAKTIHDGIIGTVARPTDALHMASQAVDLALQSVLCLIITFYFLLDGSRFGAFMLRFLDRRRRARAIHITDRIHVVLGRWLRGQLFLIALIAVVLYLLLGPWLGVPYSLTIAIASGVLEIIPLVGPLIAAAIATTAAFADGGTNEAIIVVVIYVVLRQIEDQVVMPLVIGRAVHLHPVVTIFAVLVGLSVFGVLGGLLGVPVAAALNVTLHELYPEETGESARLEPSAADRPVTSDG